MWPVVFGHRDEENDPEIMLLALALQMYLRQSSDIVDPGQPIFPFEDIDWVLCELKKGRKVRRNGLSALKDA